MLGELSQSEPLGEARKTEEHVRIHLLPYLGGSAAIKALLTDKPSDPNCTVCYADKWTSGNVTTWLPTYAVQQLKRCALTGSLTLRSLCGALAVIG